MGVYAMMVFDGVEWEPGCKCDAPPQKGPVAIQLRAETRGESRHHAYLTDDPVCSICAAPYRKAEPQEGGDQ